MEALTQTQERKLWASIRNGNEHAIKWNEILTVFAGLDMARQNVALKKMPIDKFLLVNGIFESAVKSRQPEIDKHSARSEGIKELKRLMREQGVSLEELAEPEPVKKTKYKARRDSLSPDALMTALSARADHGIVRVVAKEVAEQFNIGVSTAYCLLTALKEDGRLVALERGKYQIIPKGVSIDGVN